MRFPSNFSFLLLVATSCFLSASASPGLSKGAIAPLPIVACPSEYLLVADSCIQVVQVEPKLKCENGKLDGNVCVWKEVVKAAKVCPPQFENFKGKCQRPEIVPPEFYCEKHYDLINGECVKYTVFPSEGVCPKGFKHADEGLCLQKSYTEAIFRCPEGFAYGGDSSKNCVLINTSPPEVSCPKDYLQEEGECLKIETAPLYSKCPKGFKDSAGQCVKTQHVNPLQQCPPGSIEDKKKCLVQNVAPFFNECPKDTALQDGRCVAALEKAVEYVCEKGYHLKGNTCLAEEKFLAEERCAPGTVLEKKKCIAQVFEQPEPGCHKDYILEGGFCVKRHTTLPKSECPKGYYPEDERCATVHSVKPELVCPVGEVHGKGCLSLETAPEIVGCDNGYSPLASECTKNLIAPVKVKCPHGFKEVDGEFCEKKVYREAESECPPGAVRKGSKCSNYVPPYTECPKHYTMDAVGQCIRTETVPHQFVCPKAYELVGQKCKALHTHSK